MADTHRGRGELAAVLKRAVEEVEITYPKPRTRGAGVSGSGGRRRYGKNRRDEQTLQGRLGLRHYRSRWQSDEDPGVFRHTSTGAGLRNGREPQTLGFAIERGQLQHNQRIDCLVIGGGSAGIDGRALPGAVPPDRSGGRPRRGAGRIDPANEDLSGLPRWHHRPRPRPTHRRDRGLVRTWCR